MLSCLSPWANLFVIGSVCRKDRAVWGKCSMTPLFRGRSLTQLLAQHQPPWGKGRETSSPEERGQSCVLARQKGNRECLQINPEVRAHIARAVSKVKDCGPRRQLG